MTTIQVTVYGPKKQWRENSNGQLNLDRGVDITASPPKKLSHSIEEILKKPFRVGEERRKGLSGWSVNRQNEECPYQHVHTEGTFQHRVRPQHVHIVTDWRGDHTSFHHNTEVTRLHPGECNIDRISPDHSGDSSSHSNGSCKDSIVQDRAGREEGQDQGRTQWERNSCQARHVQRRRRKTRTSFTTGQVEKLEKVFLETHYPDTSIMTGQTCGVLNKQKTSNPRTPGCLVCSSVNSIGIDKEQGQGVSLSREWMNFEIQVSGQGSRTTSLSILRNKVRKHALSKAHTQAVKVAEQQKEAAIENAVETMTESYMKETEAVFRTAYHLAKKNRPFSDHESLIELQELNGIWFQNRRAKWRKTETLRDVKMMARDQSPICTSKPGLLYSKGEEAISLFPLNAYSLRYGPYQLLQKLHPGGFPFQPFLPMLPHLHHQALCSPWI
ncbi:unnamed protein product [Coregonus sp. 'balchen']|nr:unnamed protein product [Coregonus sp. 'balchen']